jgi:hypothetical protein
MWFILQPPTSRKLGSIQIKLALSTHQGTGTDGKLLKEQKWSGKHARQVSIIATIILDTMSPISQVRQFGPI